MTEYDETEELGKYLQFNWHRFMTPLERRAEYLGALREKSRYTGNGAMSAAVRNELRAEYDARVDDEVRQLIGETLEDVRAFQRRVTERIEGEIARGDLTPNRCPACNRIVKTPKARLRLWCGHDWH